jgi:hypothetical protein
MCTNTNKISRYKNRKYAWLKGFVRTDGVLAAVTIDKDGVEDYVATEAVSSLHLPTGSSQYVHLHTNTCDWTVENSRRYLEARRFPVESADSHSVFSIRHDGREILIPALALIKALFKQHVSNYRYLFHPAGLELLCRPALEGGHHTIELADKMGKAPRYGSMFELLRWIYYYPSARAMWNSVYARASNGVCSIQLPKAKIRIAVSGTSSKGGILLTAGTVTAGNIEPLENPYDWAGEQPKFLKRKFGNALGDEIVFAQQVPSDAFSATKAFD